MNEKEIEDLDRYLTTPPESTYPAESESPEWSCDDFGNIVFENDWIFIAYFKHKKTLKKFVTSQDGFMTVLDEYGPTNLITDKLEVISGKEWLAMQKGNDCYE
ncbi:hypothetical protein [Melissococcus plutonius]|uniref:Uncharacterized protein n=1 Tax=Melissococcus plutonius (strain ATCC 35311 / DSM 29964 / CIP 104052 / LMG 20360 / NCIMB 702443) TaxID=940190 RepID=F3YBJ1_MELPT|nr:hypothetical protein [Melissococcus plutonius]KMT33296.1 hypothetical protein MEPL6_1c03310 [Melissococcus plutonius]KMT33642.1 hypothetical protein MEPL8_7c00800 [Melissococcus plutonius]KMT38995.1 hypothetical protein MEPL12_5c01010 [Melissococcus plutonius]MBB5177531.1 hypothetical protein [Melissococcus plutonius]BAK21869.1 hypothetical protein MPTP_1440 [Melissococcus plutonius ATCC 35311]